LYGVLLEILYFLLFDGLSSHILSVFLDQEIINFGILDAVVAANNQILITYIEHCLTLSKHEVLLLKWVLDTCEVLGKRLDHVDEIEIKIINLVWVHIARWDVQHVSHLGTVKANLLDLVVMDVLEQSLLVLPNLD
jgi:hypothetical protein